MPIKKSVCRTSERARMKKLHAAGYSVEQISNAVSVIPELVQQVLDGTWDKAEKKYQAAQKKSDEARAAAKEKEKEREATLVAKAAVAAVQEVSNQQPPSEVPEQENEDGDSKQHQHQAGSQ